MAVITTDILIENTRRDDVLTWMEIADNHERVLSGAWDDVSRTGDRTWDCTLKTFPKARVMSYSFDSTDRSHAGRRVLCTTGGKRTGGKLNYSLRTPRASRNTLVTLHLDYDPGSILGAVLDSSGLRDALEAGLVRMLSNMQQGIYSDNG
ncbi:MAG: hypothetical protein GY913_25440 [Proteobacteria bacterium]|nr:hypothetical protein [Pseudomonadota bacterium]MCP4920258.1 hypothetical protein [Pseudomonadota bacterium]